MNLIRAEIVHFRMESRSSNRYSLLHPDINAFFLGVSSSGTGCRLDLSFGDGDLVCWAGRVCTWKRGGVKLNVGDYSRQQKKRPKSTNTTITSK